MRTGKGEAEPARLKGGQPPVQPSDTRLGRASGTGAQDCGLQRGEQRLRQNGEIERGLPVQTSAHLPESPAEA